MVKVTISSGKRSDAIEIPANATLTDLKKAYRSNMDIHRKAFKLKDASGALVALGDKGSLADQGVRDNAEIVFKDLGPQIGYRTVFVVEYAGPLGMMLFYASQPSFIYGSAPRSFSYVQSLFIALFAAHFIKRELETFFVHKFSRPTMPMRNIFKNCIYYWSFAAFIGYVLCHPNFTDTCTTQANVGAVLMVISELLNFAVHFQLSRMRKGDGDQTRNVPSGPLFSLVSCPNYTFEVLSWVAFSIGTNMLSSWFFTLAGFLQMLEWALKKHKGYIKADPKNKKKASMVPFVI